VQGWTIINALSVPATVVALVAILRAARTTGWAIGRVPAR